MPRQTIRQQNDTFRRDIFNDALGAIILSPAVAALSDADRFALLSEIQYFEDWESGHPARNHNFGIVSFRGIKYVFNVRAQIPNRRKIYIAQTDEF